MKRSAVLAALLLCSAAIPAMALNTPAPGREDSHVRTVAYSQFNRTLIIGTVGRSGRASAPHLHFEVRYEGIVYNPQYLLPPRDVIEREEAPDVPSESVRAQGVDAEPDE